MKRHPQLIPISQDHHHSLALCLRILRQPEACHRAEIEAHRPELLAHFQAEETLFAPLWSPLNRPDLQQRFENDHQTLRQLLHQPQWQNPDWQTELAHTLREHARFEERELFPALTPWLPTETNDTVHPPHTAQP